MLGALAYIEMLAIFDLVDSAMLVPGRVICGEFASRRGTRHSTSNY